MKPTVYFSLLLSLVLLLSACAGGAAEDSSLAGVFPCQTSEAKVTYFHCGVTTEWALTAEELEKLEAWALALPLTEQSFPDGETPGDRDGGSGYTFQLGDKSFSYILAGEADYILLDGTWYLAEAPSVPPVSVPSGPELTAEDVEKVEAYHFIVPADAEKKVVTDSASIQEALDLLHGAAPTDAPPEAVTGGATVSFRLTLSAGEMREWVCTEAADSLWAVAEPEGTRETLIDCAAFWESLPIQAEAAKEAELPVLP